MFEKKIFLYDDQVGYVQYIEHMGSDKKIVDAARISYGKEVEELTEKDVKLIKYLMEHKHTTPFEHNCVSFKFVVSLFTAVQHMRHRVWSFNARSFRYSSEDIQFYETELFRKQDDKNKQASKEENFIPDMSNYSSQSAFNLICEHHDRSVSLYNALLNAGIAREQARGILPQDIYTSYYGTCDLHNLFKFLDLRNTNEAQYEIRQVAKAIQEILLDIYPISTKLYLELKENKCQKEQNQQ